MGAVKDLVDLVTQLSNSIEDRKFAAELREIQSMIGGIQSEHAATHEQRIDLMTENAELKQTIAALKENIVTLQQENISLKNTPQEKPAHKLTEESQKVLMYLTKYTDVTSNQIAQNLSLDLTRTEHWLDVLEDEDMVSSARFFGGETAYSIASEGRKYLVTHNMI